ncbi:hypothetical protein LY76DRAFT_586673 [Colletotrichum caudatum]|nr:hypothetical protein LY76DRAFT_586673 [Colletotrichum caudatum]
MGAELSANSTIKNDKVYVCCPLRVIPFLLSAHHGVLKGIFAVVSASTSLDIPCAPRCSDFVHHSSPISHFCGAFCVAELAIIASVGRPELIRPADLGLTIPWATCPCYGHPTHSSPM